MAGKLYCLESVTYLTAGLEDASKNPDIEVESVEIKRKNNNLNLLRLKVL